MNNIFSDNFSDYMDSEILYNRLDFSGLDIEAFNNKYEIKELKYNGDDYWAHFESGILDDIAEKSKVKSVRYNRGKCVYILMEKDSDFNFDNLFNDEKFEKYSFKDFHINEEDKYNKEPWKISIVYNLMLNTLARTADKTVNYSGQLFQCVSQKKSEIIGFVYAVRDGIMTYQQQTFTKYNENCGADKAAYRIVSGTNGTKLFRREYKDLSECYVRGSHKVNRMKYDNLYVDRTNTKVDFFNKIFSAFNYAFKGIAEIKFLKLPVKYKPIESVASTKNMKLKDFEELGTINFMVMNDINPNVKSISTLKETLVDAGVKLEYNNEFNRSMPNIVVIHNKQYYDEEKIEDVKKSFPKEYIIQSVTIETLEDMKADKSINAIAFKMLSELIIKRDLMNNFIPEWKYGPFEFYLGIRNRTSLGDEAKHVLMRIDDRGNFNIIDDPVEIGSNFTKYINGTKFKKNNKYFKNGNVCIVKKDNNMNSIYHTDYFPLMDYEQKCMLDEIANRTRSKAADYKHNKLLYPYVGKILMDIDGKVNYAIGLADNFQPSVANNSNIYCIDPINNEENSSDFIVEIPELLESIHVRGNSTESVWPFPFKYLMEYIRIHTQETGLCLS